MGPSNGAGITRSCNILDKLQKKEQPTAKQLLRSMSYAESRGECEKQRDRFVLRYRKTYPKATETLLNDWDRMVSLYSFPREHWVHLRTTNIVEPRRSPKTGQ